MLARPVTPVRRARRNDSLREEVNNATPVQLLNLLFNRLMLDLERGRLALEARDYETANKQLLHAQEILTELTATLNLDSWGGARNLLSVYQWCEISITRGNIQRNPRFIADAIKLLTPLQEAWQQAAASPDIAAMNRTV